MSLARALSGGVSDSDRASMETRSYIFILGDRQTVGAKADPDRGSLIVSIRTVE